KDKREPIHCLKCQKFSHFAKDCKANHNTCGTCGAKHRTSKCKSCKMYYCVACDTPDHASSDQECPEFVRKCADLDSRTPDNAMPYF
ncbi:hypothetical protein F5J12DRAFT_707014, partial [Pisolithus orientalis]|uniref:uncharacterized protein n=1 Tax=Pisolithus orientalis TaxID=936130 RepID=UPI00222477C8